MSVNLSTIVYEWGFFLMLAAISPKHTAPDSVKILSSGTGNLIMVDSLMLLTNYADTVVSSSVRGTITQTGRQNSAEIKSGKTGKDKKTKSTIKINQKGNSNKVKINSQ
jgi:hypothetical protein